MMLSKMVKKTVSFGATGYSDFIKHKDEERKQRYIARHTVNQNGRIIAVVVFGLKLP